MKTLIAIWAAVVIVALGTGVYVNAAIDDMVNQPTELQGSSIELQPAATLQADTYNPQQTIEASQLQRTINGKDLQGN